MIIIIVNKQHTLLQIVQPSPVSAANEEYLSLNIHLYKTPHLNEPVWIVTIAHSSVSDTNVISEAPEQRLKHLDRVPVHNVTSSTRPHVHSHRGAIYDRRFA